MAEQILDEITTILEANYQGWQRLATEKLSQSERNQRLAALDDRAVKLLELLERKWRLDDVADQSASISQATAL